MRLPVRLIGADVNGTLGVRYPLAGLLLALPALAATWLLEHARAVHGRVAERSR